MTRRKELRVYGLSQDKTQKEVFLLFLQEKESLIQLPIFIGQAEAQAIIMANNGIEPPRPLSHSLFSEILLGFDIEIKEVYINKVVDKIFHAEICCDRFGMTKRFDSRVSDAVALALRFKAPIYTNDEVLLSSGIPSSNVPPRNEKSPKQLLEFKLKKAIEKEDYELAARLRDEISRLDNEGLF